MIPTADLPDIFGNTIFCDDIRQEMDGKITYVGVYEGTMLVHSQFPATLPKFAFSINFIQRREVFVPNVGLRIFLPGDSEEKASIEAEIEQTDKSASAFLAASTNPETPNVLLKGNIILSPLVISEPGTIKVRILRESVLHRLGMLRVIAAPTLQPSTTTF